MFEILLKIFKWLYIMALATLFVGGASYIGYRTLFGIGDWYRGGRMPYLISSEKTFIVDSVWFVERTIVKNDYPQVSLIRYYRFKNFTGKVRGTIGDKQIGDSVKAIYNKDFDEYLITNSKNKQWQAFEGLGGYGGATIMLIAFVVLICTPFGIRAKASFINVHHAIMASGSPPPSLLSTLAIPYTVLHYTVQMLPSILSVFVNFLALFAFFQILFLIEKMNAAVAGGLIIMMLLYTALVAPLWIKWLYFLKYSSHGLLVMLRLVFQIGTGIFLVNELSQIVLNPQTGYEYLLILENKLKELSGFFFG